MKLSYRKQTRADSAQLRWIVLLLAVAVILPTVCLLWFMSQAVKNERLAVRQKLIDAYTKRAQDLFVPYADIYWDSAESHLRSQVDAFSEYSEHIGLLAENITHRKMFAAVVIYDDQEQLQYPLSSAQTHNASSQDAIAPAWKLEFNEGNYADALKEYGRIAKDSTIPHIAYECKMGMVRCLSKQSKSEEAMKVCYELAYPPKHIAKEYTPAQIGRARLMLANLYSQANNKDLLKELQRQFFNSTLANDPEFTPVYKLPTATKAFILDELINIAKDNNLTGQLEPRIQEAQQIINSSLISIMAADYLERNVSLESWPKMVFRGIQSPQPLYGINFTIGRYELFCLATPEQISEFWQRAADDFSDKLVFCRVYDQTGQQVAGEPKLFLGQEVQSGSTFSTLDLKEHFDGWKVELYLRFGVFREAADRQKLIYIWVAALVIGLMLVSMFLATRAVFKQAKLNRLKNDLIATVSHELKTPLASMRVLVDTLVEGRYEDQQQARDYFGLIAKENERLSRLIDNFLTFSRMERNKKAFDFAQFDLAEVVSTAVDSVADRFNKADCQLDVDIASNLPKVTGDRDALITVLLNLLDNAYKYSQDDKRIGLRAYSTDDNVCLEVSDNGIGMSRRSVKKIFNRFYQVDQSLARKTGGCGLGLSIVKFIVDAHAGSINVTSQPGKGSTFTVKLPAGNSDRSKHQGSI